MQSSFHTLFFPITIRYPEPNNLITDVLFSLPRIKPFLFLFSGTPDHQGSQYYNLIAVIVKQIAATNDIGVIMYFSFLLVEKKFMTVFPINKAATYRLYIIKFPLCLKPYAVYSLTPASDAVMWTDPQPKVLASQTPIFILNSSIKTPVSENRHPRANRHP